MNFVYSNVKMSDYSFSDTIFSFKIDNSRMPRRVYGIQQCNWIVLLTDSYKEIPVSKIIDS